jgi:hypothetical protein
MTLRTLEARWEKTEEFVDVDLVASFDEAKMAAIKFQLDHHVRALIEWTEVGGVAWGRNKFVTFRLQYAT